MSEPTPAAPEPTPYSAPAGGTPSKSPVLSIVSLVLGIISFLGGWIVLIPVIGSILHLFLPAGAVITGFLGKSKEPQAAKGLWLTGIILGFVGLAIAIVSLILWIAALGSADWSQLDSYQFEMEP
ncbi:DUF4190 domain-containing protein [Salinibacterium sp. SYSU T00001]|uniref:DUF4190 domain-containing protein n=1 Tax=Homoserinimonas sedimenticola TaxID=2986805 RepID=UPI00223674A8|nr:DUF4190 domain-containing protein [Salinibacterium sedimenticola]MCW4385278.1 DUF4190 domain-containing protein [Salinibacterium sedimenticola]